MASSCFRHLSWEYGCIGHVWYEVGDGMEDGRGDGFIVIPTTSYMCYGVGVFPLILRNEVRGVNVLPFEPLIIGVRISFCYDRCRTRLT